jgi:putative membrane protein
MTGPTPRKPQVFTPDDPNLVFAGETEAERSSVGADDKEVPPSPLGETGRRETIAERAGRGIRWGTLLVAAASALASLAFALSFARFVSIALERNDWIGWLSFGLLAVIAVSGLVLIVREIVGFARLARLGRIRADAEKAIRERDRELERTTLKRITAPHAARAELKWPLARLAEETREVRDPGDLLRLADRTLLVHLDGEARRRVASAARRIATVTAISPTAALTIGWVAVENLRLLRALATLYGGRPGFFATAKLARMVFLHIVATGGVALTDDLVGQFLGQDILRRLSRRLGESVFNAAMTARIGAAAIEMIRPLPYLEAPRIRARDFIGEITRWRTGDAEAPSGGTQPPRGDR